MEGQVLQAVMLLIETLTDDQLEVVRSRLFNGSGKVGDTVTALVNEIVSADCDWTPDMVRNAIIGQVPKVTTKQIYNSLDYLVRSGRIRRVGYGKFRAVSEPRP